MFSNDSVSTRSRVFVLAGVLVMADAESCSRMDFPLLGGRAGAGQLQGLLLRRAARTQPYKSGDWGAGREMAWAASSCARVAATPAALQ